MRLVFPVIVLAFGLVVSVGADSRADELQEGRAAIRAGDYDRGVRLLLPLAKGGNGAAQNVVGVLYAKGWGVAQDHRAAAEWYRKSAEQGNPKGQMNLGQAYQLGRGIRRDYAEAIKWYRISAEQGFAGGMFSLGVMYEDGLGIDQSYQEAMKWYRKAAEQGDPTAQNNVGVMYASGKGVEQDYAEAIKWYRKAAEQGDVSAQHNLGLMHELGQGLAPNREEALKWYAMAAKRGHPGARERLEALSGAAGTKEGPARASLDQALNAPPRDLAVGYLTIQSALSMVEIARQGATIQTADGTIDASNAETYVAVYEKRLTTYAAAIDQRGYQKVAGHYSARATDACKAAGSMLVGLILGGKAREIAITQDRFKVKLTQNFSVENRHADIAHNGVVVETVLVVSDATAPDFTFLGNLRQGEIELRPWVANIQAAYSRYPPGFPPRPNWDQLSECAVILKKTG